MKIGITGHQKLKDSSLWGWVTSQINESLDQQTTPLVGFTSLAIGADQFFAESILQHGGILHVVVPFEGYEKKFSQGNDRDKYLRLLNQASAVDVLNWYESDEASYFEAGKKIADLSNILFAVWDGNPAAGLGGTGDVVEYAIKKNKKIVHIDPINKKVSEK